MELFQKTTWNMVSQIELVYKSKIKVSERPQVNSARSSFELLLDHWDKDFIELKEQSIALLLNNANRIMAMYRMSSGGISGTVVDPKLLFIAALKANATAIILAHNHPSGNLSPSQQDLAITEKIKQAGRFLDIKLLDHLIITLEGFYSFADEGLI